ncbi:MAG: ABC transporter permease [Firmicutes bacterium]|nr:ABC transporter permease [Bacillota bacterium]
MSKNREGTRGGSCQGVGNVFRFTLQQMVKNKANLIILVILLLVAVLAVPVGGIFLADESEPVMTSYVSVLTMEDYLDGGGLDEGTQYVIQYAYSIIVMIVCVFSVTYIVRAIVEEKVSRLVETLMVSIRPLALVFGKILAVMVFVFAQLVLLAGAAVLSYTVCGQFMDVSYVWDFLGSMGITAEALHLGAVEILILAVSLFLAYLFFSLLAGLAGAGCANMDEIEGANMAAMGAILAGYIVSAIGFAVSDGIWLYVMAICPAVSAFTAPVYYLFGDISFGVLAASWGVELVLIVVLLLITAKVYDQLILYKGSRMKLGRILAMAAFGQKGGRRA